MNPNTSTTVTQRQTRMPLVGLVALIWTIAAVAVNTFGWGNIPVFWVWAPILLFGFSVYLYFIAFVAAASAAVAASTAVIQSLAAQQARHEWENRMRESADSLAARTAKAAEAGAYYAEKAKEDVGTAD